ncbi:P-loop containing nucleoside triphosphate hydrolase protein [Cantharellus anzutake]|uniref:P-loop containing nucleoside triphosphate hydrolase protein n=1 Tax=Cantharellus anzutake TaxID=1750568 RepID=UPI0019047F35|nr:P-loop containing nucleoside triphosphate hydrolase protein [Cantharellus anzutake]KAF8321497.1 P-loop containing nucleoside triphosphate hydrolase protein [Cantharellus anzutake]
MSGPPVKVRYNAKARGAEPGTSGKRMRHTAKKAAPVIDNVDQSVEINSSSAQGPPSENALSGKERHEAEWQKRKEKMRTELVNPNKKMSGKKKKLLNKYIEKKLKKEERLTLFQKLTETQAHVSPLLLQSTATLHSGRPQTHAERLAVKEDRQVRRAIDGHGSSRKKRRKLAYSGIYEEPTDEEGEELPLEPTSRADVRQAASPVPTASAPGPPQSQRCASPSHPSSDAGAGAAKLKPRHASGPKVALGAGLKRNVDGTVVAPRVVPKKSKENSKVRLAALRGKKLPSPPPDVDTPGSSASSEIGSHDKSHDSTEEGSGHMSSDEDSSDVDSSEVSSKDSGSEDEGESQPAPRPNFKDWARRQIETVKSADAPSNEAVLLPDGSVQLAENLFERQAVPQRRSADGADQVPKGPLGEDLQLPQSSFAQAMTTLPPTNADASGQADTKPVIKYVTVERPASIQAQRLLLPVVAEEQPIMEAVRLNPVVVICGETGSGKTTQVPQFLYEAGFGVPGSENPGMIGVTQPRRVAAVSMAARVAQELNLPPSRVSYQIRYDATVSLATSIKFMTDGVLLRELATDLLLTKYSVIIIDEAHERSVNTDILVGVLSRVIKLREELWAKKEKGAKPLRLIIMSATLRVTDFTENTTLFAKPPPVINIAARQHPVTVHFNRRTNGDYVAEAVRKASKIHARLPPGGILIFLTGQNEINGVCAKLEKLYGKKALGAKRKNKAQRERDRVTSAAGGADIDMSHGQPDQTKIEIELEDIEEAGNNVDQVGLVDEGEGEEDPDALDSQDELDIDEPSDEPMHIVPLYSILSSEKQMKVFEPPPEGSRLVVVATNVAETSLTIPNIRYVVDCGRAKQRRHDIHSGVESFQVSFISKASAAQRAGRAGRVGPGHCYRLYSSALYENHFEQFAQPEILNVPIEGLVLQMKSMHIDAVANFPFPTPPNRLHLQKAETILTHLGALDSGAKALPWSPYSAIGGQITDLGRTMSLFPVSPRFSKILALGRQHGTLPYAIALVAIMSIGSPFLHEDALDMDDGDDDNEVDGNDAETHNLSEIRSEDLLAKEKRRIKRKRFFQAQQAHSQLGVGTSDFFSSLSVVGAYEYAGGGTAFCAEHFVRLKAMEEIHKLRAQLSSIVESSFPKINADFSPTLPHHLSLRQLIVAGLIDHVAVRKDLAMKDSGVKYANARNVPYMTLDVDEDIFIHPSSILFGGPPPEYVVYQDIVRTKPLTVVNPAWLATLGRSLCTFSKPKEVPATLKAGTGTL